MYSHPSAIQEHIPHGRYVYSVKSLLFPPKKTKYSKSGSLIMANLLWIAFDFITSLQRIKLFLRNTLRNLSNWLAKFEELLVTHVIRVGLFSHFHHIHIVAEHKLLHVFVHKPTHVEKMFGLISMLVQLLLSWPMPHQPLEITLVALHHFFALSLVMFKFEVGCSNDLNNKWNKHSFSIRFQPEDAVSLPEDPLHFIVSWK